MQFQPLVESSPIHQQRHSASKTQPHQDHIRLVRHPQLTGLNRLRSVVQNLTHSFHHFHHHSENFAAISADQAVSSHLMSGHHHIQMGRLRKLAATGILGRFRSSSRTTSDDDEAPAARGSTSHDARFKAELDPTLGDRCGASNSGVTSPSQFLSSQSKGQVNRISNAFLTLRNGYAETSDCDTSVVFFVNDKKKRVTDYKKKYSKIHF